MTEGKDCPYMQAAEAVEERVRAMEQSINTMHVYLLGNGDVKKSVVFLLETAIKELADHKNSHTDFEDKIAKEMADHKKSHDKVEGRAWELLKPIIQLILGGIIGAAFLYMTLQAT